MLGTGWVLSKYFEIIDEQMLFSPKVLISVGQSCRTEMQVPAQSCLYKSQVSEICISFTIENIHGLCLDGNKTFHSWGPREIISSSSFWSGRTLSKCNAEVHKDIIRTSSRFIHLFFYSLNKDLLNSLYVSGAVISTRTTMGQIKARIIEGLIS